jgi:hypothetical protein
MGSYTARQLAHLKHIDLMVTAETFNSMRQDLDKLKLDGNVNADGFLDGHLGEACKP